VAVEVLEEFLRDLDADLGHIRTIGRRRAIRLVLFPRRNGSDPAPVELGRAGAVAEDKTVVQSVTYAELGRNNPCPKPRKPPRGVTEEIFGNDRYRSIIQRMFMVGGVLVWSR
jgi:hypothetical protein